MQPLSGTSQRRSYAARFADALRKAIKARGASKIRVCEATGVPRSNLGYYLTGRNLPTVAVAKVLAEVLDAPALLELVVAGRTVTCGRAGCSRSFLYEGGKPKVYCSEDCATLARKMAAAGDEFDTGGRALHQALAAELDRVRGTSQAVRRRLLQDAADEYARTGSKRHARLSTFRRRIDGLHEAIDTMCRECEPEGLCHLAACPLRAYSPLPLAGAFTEEKKGRRIREPEGPHGPTFRASWLAATRAGNARRWAREGERERAAAVSLAVHARRTPEEREAWRQSISDARRRQVEEAAS